MAEATQEPSQREVLSPMEIMGEGSEINKILTSPSFTPKKLVDVFKGSSNLRELYEGSVGVWEGYSLEEHTLMAMGQFERYFSSEWSSPLVSKEHFRLMLALHDLGKPQALRETNSVIQQHEYTMRMISGILQQAGLDQREIDIIKGIINQDFLGGYVRNRQSLDITAKLISERAQQVGVPATEFMNLLRIYYMCDAGSYTEDAGGKRSLDALFTFDREKRKMGFSPTLQDKLDKLLGNLEFQKVPQKEMAQATVQETPKKEVPPEVAKKGEQLRMSPSFHYERDAEKLYPQALRAFESGNNEALIELIPRIFPVDPLYGRHMPVLYHGVFPYQSDDERDRGILERRSFGKLLSPREYVDLLLRIQQEGLTSPNRDQLFSDRNIKGVYFVDRPEVTWGILYIAVPTLTRRTLIGKYDVQQTFIPTEEGDKPVFVGKMKGMVVRHGEEFIVYSQGQLRAPFKVGLKPEEISSTQGWIDREQRRRYYKEVEKEFNKTFGGELIV